VAAGQDELQSRPRSLLFHDPEERGGQLAVDPDKVRELVDDREPSLVPGRPVQQPEDGLEVCERRAFSVTLERRREARELVPRALVEATKMSAPRSCAKARNSHDLPTAPPAMDQEGARVTLPAAPVLDRAELLDTVPEPADALELVDRHVFTPE